MSPPPLPPLSEDELHALVDGRLAPDEREALETRLAEDPAAAAQFAAWRAQREALRALHGPVLQAPVPPALRAAAARTAAVQQQLNQWWRWGGMAAGLLLAFGVGWLSHGQWQARPQAAGVLAQARAGQEFARQAALAHAVFSPEVRHPVEVTASDQAHLLQWLSKRLGRPLKVPDLSAQGYVLVGGRLLPGGDGARAQFMFEQAGGARLTLYLGALAAPGSTPPSETAFRFFSEGPVAGFYWVDQGFGYALSGPLPRAALMPLAEAVYRQL
ncbi:anti-sigma factor [Ramlibacter sp. 2FC]|uniref:anti-sigma factor family protein n=1 Tax=Ramlibacter sp. 2FC TaxID=2502188 RepID=UPI001484D86D|nr:anti-sigma factor [Ramlibacter sp. 2FC]